MSTRNKRKKHTNKRRHGHEPVTPEQREMFWKMISRKGGIHIRF